MGAFDTVFVEALAQPKSKAIREDNFANLLADEQDVVALKQALEKDGLHVEYLVDSGRQGFLFKLKGVESGVLRITESASDPVDSPAVLTPVLHKQHGRYHVSVVPLTVGAGEVTFENYLRTTAILKHQGVLEHFGDCSIGQMSYLTDDKGERLRYRDGTPIAFIHDIDSIPANLEQALGQMGTDAAYRDSVVTKLSEIQESLRNGNDEREEIAPYRVTSEKGKEIVDDDKFLTYLIDVLKQPVTIPEGDLEAPRQQAIATTHLRQELAKLEGLAPDLREQIQQQREWEKVPTQIPALPKIQVINPSQSVIKGHE